jgi:hypothetical protein
VRRADGNVSLAGDHQRGPLLERGVVTLAAFYTAGLAVVTFVGAIR